MSRKVYDLLNLMAVTFDKPQSQERLVVYCENLKEFQFKEVETSVKWHMQNSKFFPSLAEIRERIKPNQVTEENAIEMTSAILEAARNYGYHRLDEAKKELGMVAWMAVHRGGGWLGICSITNDQVTSTRAQLKGICKTVLGMFQRDPESCKLEYQKNATEELKQLEVK